MNLVDAYFPSEVGLVIIWLRGSFFMINSPKYLVGINNSATQGALFCP